MADAMPAALLAEWREFARVEPFGFDIEEFRAGRLNSTVANFRPFRSAESKVFAPADFMYDPDAPPPKTELTVEEHKARAIAWCKATGGYPAPKPSPKPKE